VSCLLDLTARAQMRFVTTIGAGTASPAGTTGQMIGPATGIIGIRGAMTAGEKARTERMAKVRARTGGDEITPMARRATRGLRTKAARMARVEEVMERSTKTGKVTERAETGKVARIPGTKVIQPLVQMPSK